jgi:hypothetical protein
MAAGSKFEATWIPRIGERATAELRRCRRVGMSAIVASLVFASSGSIALGGDTPDKIVGVVLLVGMVGALATFINCQRRLGAAVSEWFGVRITGGGLPKMYPKRFDEWCDERGLRPAPKLRDGERVLWSRSGSAPRPSGRLSGGRRVAGTVRVTSERIMFVPARFGSITLALPKIDQSPIGELQSVEVSCRESLVGADIVQRPVCFTFRDGRALKVTIDRADDALGELRALLAATLSI